MQYKNEQLQRQQVIMAKLGYYKNKCDGIWGPASIAAKKEWESLPSFIPGLPTNGLPFGERDYTPKGVRFDKQTRMFTCEGLTEEDIRKYTNSVTDSNTPRTEQTEQTEQTATANPEVVPQATQVASTQVVISESNSDLESAKEKDGVSENNAQSAEQRENKNKTFQNHQFKKHKNR